MAISYARVEFVSRSKGKTAPSKAAYNSRSQVEFEGNGIEAPQVFDWSSKERPMHHEVILPEGVHEKFKNLSVLWNAAEVKEKRSNSQVAVDLVLALPDDKVFSLEDRIQLTRSFVQAHFVDEGLAAQIDIHLPDKKIEIHRDNEEMGLLRGMRGSLIQETETCFTVKLEDGREISFNPKEFTGFVEKEHNWHAHVLLTTRRFNENGTELGEKARDLMPRICKGRVVSGQDWSKLWTDHQNSFFAERGLALRVDFNGITAQEHLGPVRMRGRAFSLIEEHGRRVEENAIESTDPAKILDKITERQSVFTREDVDGFMQKHVPAEALAEIRETFWKQPGVVQLVDKSSGELLEKFSSQKVVEEERRILRLADRMHQQKGLKISVDGSLELVQLSDGQKKAFVKILQGERLACIQGCAGTGKSYLLAAISKAYQEGGYRVRAFGPDSATVDVLKSKGFKNAENVYRFLFALRNNHRKIASGKELWIFDETSKLGNRPFLELLKEAEKKDVQLIFSGDFAQLPPVERGGMFKTLCERYPSIILDEIQRQKSGKQKEFAKSLATGEFGAAIDKLCMTQGIKWTGTKKEAIEQLITHWSRNKFSPQNPSSLIIAHTNDEVRVLNEMVRIVRKQRGELQGKEFSCETAQGKIYISVGDRIEFRKNDKELGITNGLSGTLIEAKKDRFVVSIKESDKGTRIVSFNPQEHHSYQLGYASTYYRSQGRTVEKAYVLHSPYLNKEMFYVGLTRHVEEVYYFVSKEDVRCLSDLKAQSMRGSLKETTLAFFTGEEVQSQLDAEQRQKELLAFKNSDSVVGKAKGYGLSAWDHIRSKAHGVHEKIQDRSPDKQFYQPDTRKASNIKSSVTEVSLNELAASTKEESEMGKVADTPLLQEGSRVDRSSEQTRKEPTNPLALLEKRIHTKKELWGSLGTEKQNAIKSYVNAADQVATLKCVVEAETIGSAKGVSAPPHFKEWQETCGKRNALAHELVQTVPREDLKSLFSEKETKIVDEQASRYGSSMERQKASGALRIEDGLKENIEPLLFKLFPEGSISRSKTGLRFGSKGSLSIVCAGAKTGQFFDFEKQEGGGPLKLIQRELGMGRAEAERWAKDFLGVVQEIKVPQAFLKLPMSHEKNSEWISQKPDASVVAPKLEDISGKKLHLYFNEEGRHAYRNEDNQLLYYVLRLRDKQDPSRKITPPLSYGQWKGSPGKNSWELKGFQAERNFLYNLPSLKENPSAGVLVVEGEKTADAALSRLPGANLICITWPGGSGAVSKADWIPLLGREVVIWPDNDKAGHQAAENVCSELRKVGVQSLKMVDPETLKKHFPGKWDLADSLPDGIDEGFLKKLLSNALQKGIDPQQIVHRVSSTDKENPLTIARANEILWRVDERLRPELEKQFGPQFRKVHEEILKESSRILMRRDEWHKHLQKNFGDKHATLDRLSYLALAYEAKNGKGPSVEEIKLMKELIGEVGFAKAPKGVSGAIMDFSLDRGIIKALDPSVGSSGFDKERLNREALLTAQSINKQLSQTVPHDSQQKNLGRSLERGHGI